LLGWLFAVGHMAVEHGGAPDGEAAHRLADGGAAYAHDEEGPAHEGDHDHDLTALTAGQFAAGVDHKALVPVWVLLYGAIAGGLTASLREADDLLGHFDFGCALPDARASGWLLVLQTAHPVRGPSFV